MREELEEEPRGDSTSTATKRQAWRNLPRGLHAKAGRDETQGSSMPHLTA